MTAIRGVTLDLDDTLFPQQQWLDGAWQAVAQRGAELGLDGADLHGTLVLVAAEGSDRGGIIDRAVATVARPGALPAYALVPALVAAFAAHAPRRLDCYPGAHEALRRLAQRLPVVLVTDGNPAIQRAKIAALDIEHLLTGVVVSDEIGGRAARKPSPVPFYAALDLLGLPTDAVVHVGDRPGKDVVGASSVGLRSLRVRTGEYADQPDACDRSVPWAVADDLAEAVELLLTRAATTATL